jgi:hypothetical protein
MASAPANLSPTQITAALPSADFFGGWSHPQPTNPYAAAEAMRQLTFDDIFNFSTFTT